jgi:hypothetical protein
VDEEPSGPVPADWRHLVTVPQEGTVLAVGEALPDLGMATTVTHVPDPGELAGISGVFDVITVSSRATVGLLTNAVSLLDPSTGILVVGLPPGTHKRRRGPITLQMASLRRRLGRAGLAVEMAYGTLPDPWLPEYVFRLTPSARSFALRHFVDSRTPGRVWARAATAAASLGWVARWAAPGALVLCRPSGIGNDI